jgi:hypothetical protein
MAKVYFCKFTDKKTGKFFYKFGHTTKSDVLERFHVKYDARYGEFNIKAICSIWGDKNWCQDVEEIYKARYPKNIWLEDFFGDDRKWDNFSGITEIVYLDDLTYKWAVKSFYKLKESQDKVYKRKESNYGK